MKIFLSWSGTRSHHIANALYSWLPTVIQEIEPFISSTDIDKGERGGEVIANSLEDSKMGVICLTPENLTERWILFEAGALSKTTKSPVCTYLFQLKPSDIPPPLGQFQHTTYSRDDTLRLLKTINKYCDQPLDNNRIETIFGRSWEYLEAEIEKCPEPDDPTSNPPRSADSKLDELLSLVRSLVPEKLPPFKFTSANFEGAFLDSFQASSIRKLAEEGMLLMASLPKSRAFTELLDSHLISVLPRNPSSGFLGVQLTEKGKEVAKSLGFSVYEPPSSVS